MYKRIFIKLILVFLLFSCNAQEKLVENKLKKCVNKSVNHNLKYSLGKGDFDFYIFMKEIENHLIEKRLLKNVSQTSYLELFKRIKKERLFDTKKEIIKLSDSIGLAINMFFINNAVFNECPYDVTKDLPNKKEHQIYKEGLKMSKLLNTGYEDLNNIKDVVLSIDEKHFNNIIYRVPIIYLVILNLTSDSK